MARRAVARSHAPDARSTAPHRTHGFGPAAHEHRTPDAIPHPAGGNALDRRAGQRAAHGTRPAAASGPGVRRGAAHGGQNGPARGARHAARSAAGAGIHAQQPSGKQPPLAPGTNHTDPLLRRPHRRGGKRRGRCGGVRGPETPDRRGAHAPTVGKRPSKRSTIRCGS